MTRSALDPFRKETCLHREWRRQEDALRARKMERAAREAARKKGWATRRLSFWNDPLINERIEF